MSRPDTLLPSRRRGPSSGEPRRPTSIRRLLDVAPTVIPVSSEPEAVRPIVERPVETTGIPRDRRYRLALAGADLLATSLAVGLSLWVVGGVQPQIAMALVLPIIVIAAKSIGLYDRDDLLLRKTTIDEAPQLFSLATVGALLASLLDREIPGTAIAALWASAFLLLLVLRYTARSAVTRSAPIERCLVLGSDTAANEVARKLHHTQGVNATVSAQLYFETGRVADLLPRLEAQIADHQIERVIIAPEQVDQNEILDVVRAVKALGVNVTLLPRIFEVLGSSVVFDELSGMQLLAMRRLRMSRSSLLLKRAVDIAISGLGLLVAGPFLLLCALVVKLDSRGPVFFRQTRVGRAGERFEILKFRTMVDGADHMKEALREENDTNGLFKLENDPRVTRFGRLLRRTSLDELPQLINVFKGDMSLVGPRPLVVDEDSQVVGWHRRRLALTPGMTGPWQILGSAKVPLHEMVKIDYLYVTTWSFWTDMKILLRTVPYVLRGGGL